MATTIVGLFAKIILFIVNFLFWLTGVVVLAAGVWVTIDHSTFNFLTFFDDPDLQKVAYFMIAVGGFVTLLGFIGCFGACHEREWMIWMYFGVVLLLLLAEVVCTVLLFAYNEEVKTFANETLSDFIQHDYDLPENQGITIGIDQIQNKFECCGAQSYLDWQTSEWFNRTQKMNELSTAGPRGYIQIVPTSCCMMPNGTEADIKSCNSLNFEEDRFIKGCYDVLFQVFEDHIWIIGGILIGAAFFQVILLIMAVVLLRNLLDDYD
ncbi:tetraspanin-7-like [Apostichopus japonicus]|uniref:tetraspanin-7-like n=1 Tax=Stichopus japonicus TaxID=307972 RepID=UPI003AB55B0B